MFLFTCDNAGRKGAIETGREKVPSVKVGGIVVHLPVKLADLLEVDMVVTKE